MSKPANPKLIFARLLSEAERLRAWANAYGFTDQQAMAADLIKAIEHIKPSFNKQLSQDELFNRAVAKFMKEKRNAKPELP